MNDNNNSETYLSVIIKSIAPWIFILSFGYSIYYDLFGNEYVYFIGEVFLSLLYFLLVVFPIIVWHEYRINKVCPKFSKVLLHGDIDPIFKVFFQSIKIFLCIFPIGFLLISIGTILGFLVLISLGLLKENQSLASETYIIFGLIAFLTILVLAYFTFRLGYSISHLILDSFGISLKETWKVTKNLSKYIFKLSFIWCLVITISMTPWFLIYGLVFDENSVSFLPFFIYNFFVNFIILLTTVEIQIKIYQRVKLL